MAAAMRTALGVRSLIECLLNVVKRKSREVPQRLCPGCVDDGLLSRGIHTHLAAGEHNLAKGKKLYGKYCLACHGPQG
jgi:hypothetical protein